MKHDWGATGVPKLVHAVVDVLGPATAAARGSGKRMILDFMCGRLLAI
jgi:hypothetical protein